MNLLSETDVIDCVGTDECLVKHTHVYTKRVSPNVEVTVTAVIVGGSQCAIHYTMIRSMGDESVSGSIKAGPGDSYEDCAYMHALHKARSQYKGNIAAACYDMLS